MWPGSWSLHIPICLPNLTLHHGTKLNLGFPNQSPSASQESGPSPHPSLLHCVNRTHLLDTCHQSPPQPCRFLCPPEGQAQWPFLWPMHSHLQQHQRPQDIVYLWGFLLFVCFSPALLIIPLPLLHYKLMGEKGRDMDLQVLGSFPHQLLPSLTGCFFS